MTDRKPTVAGKVRRICPCETMVENPGPYLDTCPWSDPDYPFPPNRTDDDPGGRPLPEEVRRAG